ncbi:MAG: alanine dehydrogenase [Deltaproteobacteria bacterium]|nr:alanine dehydrogenase [Deltaproteobacteria bacterium]
MIIGIPKEIKIKETRVSIVPKTVRDLVAQGHLVYVENNAGLLSGFDNNAYIQAGATILDNAADVWRKSELIVKVKEPMRSEFGYFRSDLTLFTYLHLASVPEVARELCKTKVTSIAYETIEDERGALPLLAPMSEVAGRIGTQVGTTLLHRNHGGKGILLGGVTGTSRGTVVVVGGGYSGLNAAEVAMGLGAETVVLDVSDAKLAFIEKKYSGKIKAVKSTPEAIDQWSRKADLFVGCVLVAGDRAPHVLSRAQVANMEPGSVIVDISIDQGGCVETSQPTSHEAPTYVECGVIHYCVTNMPALTPRTSTEALTTATAPYVLTLATKGIEKALSDAPLLAKGLNTKNGKVTLPVLQRLFPELT